VPLGLHTLILFGERNDLWERLVADPAAIPRAVEELLRRVTPLNNVFRTAAPSLPRRPRRPSPAAHHPRGDDAASHRAAPLGAPQYEANVFVKAVARCSLGAALRT
jgi:hypothetical protein